MDLLHRATEADIPLLSHIGITSYRHHLASLWHSSPQCDDFIQGEFSSASIRRSLLASASQWYLLMQGSPCGLVQLSTDQRRPGSEDAGLCLNKLYLLPGWTGQKLGERAFAEICALGQGLHQPFIWLEVSEQNLGARRFYQRQGMTKSHEVLFRRASQQSVIQIISLDLSSVCQRAG